MHHAACFHCELVILPVLPFCLHNQPFRYKKAEAVIGPRSPTGRMTKQGFELIHPIQFYLLQNPCSQIRTELCHLKRGTPSMFQCTPNMKCGQLTERFMIGCCGVSLTEDPQLWERAIDLASYLWPSQMHLETECWMKHASPLTNRVLKFLWPLLSLLN